jgi:hypothetical protein
MIKLNISAVIHMSPNDLTFFLGEKLFFLLVISLVFKDTTNKGLEANNFHRRDE